jgi:hypothetical protein
MQKELCLTIHKDTILMSTCIEPEDYLTLPYKWIISFPFLPGLLQIILIL